ncbi:MAG TPA: ATP-binding protein [Candidatus Dormibacteraeota bacterium]|nr:ATP-binding protein [Candidatus Dormibacteraeota bacterium]
MAGTAQRPPALDRSHALPGALLLAVVVVGAAIVLRLLDFATGSFPFGTDWFPALFAAGGLVAAALLVRRAPPIAWFSMVASAAIGAIEIVGVARAHQATTPLGAWPVAVAGAGVALIAAAGVAGAYALRRPASAARRARRMIWQVLILACLGAIAVSAGMAVAVAIGMRAMGADLPASIADPGVLRTTGRIAAGFIAIASLGGLWSDLGAPVARARARSGDLAEFTRALADELLPTSTAMRRLGVERERARLAAELHARVLPDLRRAAEAAEATGTSSDPLAIGLRHALEDVEELMHGRQSVVLEEYGLVAALEWLAERTQQRRPLVVDVELEGPSVDDAGAIPEPIARAAFRVAQLAVDNVVRHAQAARVVIRLAVDAVRIELTVEDDGVGIAPAGRAGSGRGLADMRAAAAEIAAKLRVERGERGTIVALAWPRPGGNAAGIPAGTAAVSEAPTRR